MTLPRCGLVAACFAVAAATAAPVLDARLGVAREGSESPARHAVRASGPSRVADGPRRAIAAQVTRDGRLRFALPHLERAPIVSAWLEHERERRWLSVRAVSRAARRGALRVDEPAGWSARRTRLVVRTAARAGVHGCGFGTFAAGSWPPGCWRPYSTASPFNRRLPPAPRLAAGSEAMVARLVGFGRATHLVAGQADTREDHWHPTYFSQAGDPVFRLRCTERQWGRCPVEGHAIRVPDRARPAAGTDRHLTVVDQDLGWEYDLFGVRSKSRGGGVLRFRWGGRTRIDGDGLDSGGTAARFGNLAGIVRAAELARGRIDHALFLVAYCDAGRAVYPARGAGRSCASLGLPTAGAPPLGTRFQLAMSVAEVNALPVPAWKQTILRAMATYGMFVGDTGGGSWGIKMESGSTFTSFGVPDPLVAFARTNGWSPYRGLWVGNLDEGVDWRRRLRVIDPCVTEGLC